MIEQVIQWLRDGEELEAADLLSDCSLTYLYVDTLFELSGERTHEMYDVHIEAPRKVIKATEAGDKFIAKQIESAIRECTESTNGVVRDLRWVPKLTTLGRGPADEEIASKLSTIDSEHVRGAWEKALARKATDPEGAITAARTLVETVCKHILDDAKRDYPDNADLPKLYHHAAEVLYLSPNQYTTKLVKQILGNSQAVVSGLAALRNSLGDAHGKGKDEMKPDSAHAELAVNLAGTISTFLVSVWETWSYRLEENV